MVAVVAVERVTTTSTAPRPAPLRDRTADARGVAPPTRSAARYRHRDRHARAVADRRAPALATASAIRSRRPRPRRPRDGLRRWGGVVRIERAQLLDEIGASPAPVESRSSRFRCDSTRLRAARSPILILHTRSPIPCARFYPRSRALTVSGAANASFPGFIICYSERVTYSGTLFDPPCAK